METLDQDTVVSAVCTAAGEVFRTMIGLEVAPGTAYQQKGEADPAEGVVSLIGLAGSWVGTGCVSCTARLACRIASLMLMAECQAVDSEVLDAVAEITNMIIGNVKTVLEEKLGPIGLSIPTVVFGKNFTTRSPGNGPWTVVPFACADENMEVRLCLAPNRQPQSPVRCGFPRAYVLQ